MELLGDRDPDRSSSKEKALVAMSLSRWRAKGGARDLLATVGSLESSVGLMGVCSREARNDVT